MEVPSTVILAPFFIASTRAASSLGIAQAVSELAVNILNLVPSTSHEVFIVRRAGALDAGEFIRPADADVEDVEADNVTNLR